MTMDLSTLPACLMCGEKEFEIKGNSARCTHVEPQDPGTASFQCSGIWEWGKCDGCGERTWVEGSYGDPESGPSPDDLTPDLCKYCLQDQEQGCYGIIEISCTTRGCRWIADDETSIRERFEFPHNEQITCPKCGMDESGLEIVRVGDIRLHYDYYLKFPDGREFKLSDRPVTPTRLTETWEKFTKDPQGWDGYTLLIYPVEFRLTWFRDEARVEYYCKHGTYIGTPGGPDYMCGRCEGATGTRWDDVFWDASPIRVSGDEL